MKSKLLLWTLIAVAPGFANAQSQTEHALSGAGTASCGKYIEYAKFGETNGPFTDWAQGFLSGLNLADNYSAKKAFVILPDGASINAYLDKHCRENPLSQPIMGAIALYRELRAMREARYGN